MSGPAWWEFGKRLFTKQVDPFVLRAFIAEIFGLWKSQLFNISSLNDLITHIESDIKYAPVIKFMDKLAKKSGVQKESVYAVIIEMGLDETGEPDRHSLRMIKPHLPADEKKQEIIHDLKMAM